MPVIKGKKPVSRTPVRERALVLHPAIRNAGALARLEEAKLVEAQGLALAIGLEVADARVIRLSRLNPATLIGKGVMAAFSEQIAEQGIDVVIIDAALTPTQQRNLERGLKAKVLDRTGLILEIFGERARTREGVLQVELAHLTYQKSRLVRTWTHLERQRGGFGFMGGPGERQIEADRRQIQERITRIKKELAAVAKRRALHRKARQAVPYPVAALTGYTNAGKSTLFNHLTSAGVEAAPKLFATLDPTLRAIPLPGGRKVILSDTVGFISELPTELVAAFRATLEEVLEADLILHVIDAANPGMDEQKADVLKVLKSLGVAAETPVIEVYNKIDLLDPEIAEAFGGQRVVGLSALTGEGVDSLLERMAGAFDALEPEVIIDLKGAQGKAGAWLYRHGSILEEKRGIVRLKLSAKAIGQFEKEFPDIPLKIKRSLKKTA